MGRKEEILEEVIKGFHEEGFTMDLTLSQIAKRVNLGKSTLYEYFKSKDEIYIEAVLKMIQKDVQGALLQDMETLTFEEAFKGQLKLLFDTACRSRMMMEMFTKNFMNKLPNEMRASLQETMEQAKSDITGRFIMIFTKGITEGLVKPDVDPMKIHVITSMVVGGVVRYSDVSLDIDIDQFINEIYRSSILIAK